PPSRARQCGWLAPFPFLAPVPRHGRPASGAPVRRGQVLQVPGGGFQPGEGKTLAGDDGGGEAAEEAVGLVVGAGGEEEGVGVAVGAADAGGDGPEAVDVKSSAVGAADDTAEASLVGVEGGDLAAAELADQDVAGETAEARGGDGQAPRRV